jgi:hypothetical protein
MLRAQEHSKRKGLLLLLALLCFCLAATGDCCKADICGLQGAGCFLMVLFTTWPWPMDSLTVSLPTQTYTHQVLHFFVWVPDPFTLSLHAPTCHYLQTIWTQYFFYVVVVVVITMKKLMATPIFPKGPCVKAWSWVWYYWEVLECIIGGA